MGFSIEQRKQELLTLWDEQDLRDGSGIFFEALGESSAQVAGGLMFSAFFKCVQARDAGKELPVEALREFFTLAYEEWSDYRESSAESIARTDFAKAKQKAEEEHADMLYTLWKDGRYAA